MSDLAKAVRLSPGHFSRACKKTLGDTPTAVIVSRRLEQAERLMLTSGEPLNQIALKCGFADQAHFGNRFRQHLGVSPSAWRRIHCAG